MKKVLIVTALAGFINTFLLNDIKIYQNLGYEVTCAGNNSFFPDENVLDYLAPLKVKFENIEFDSKKILSKNNFMAKNRLIGIVKREKYNIIHCHTPIPGFYIRFFLKKYFRRGTKIIYSTHGLAYNSFSTKMDHFIFYNVERYLSKFTTAIICINNEDFVSLKTMKCKNVYMLNSVGFDFGRYYYKNVNINKEEYRRSIGVSMNDIMVLSVGEISRRKNHQAIIKAISLIENKEKYVYVICGKEISNGTLKKSLIQLASKLRVRVIFLGKRHDIPEIMKISDIGALPSIREGFGMAGIQSLAAGVPLVGSSVQGILDYIKNNKTGFVCSPYDIYGFSRNICKLSDFNLRNKMIDDCIITAKRYDNHKIEKELFSIIKTICEDITI